MEVLATVFLSVLLLGLFAQILVQYTALRREVDTRRMLRSMAATELDRIRVGLQDVRIGHTYERPTQQRGVTISTTASAGEDDWAGLVQVNVVASKRLSPQRLIRVALAAYVDLREDE